MARCTSRVFDSIAACTCRGSTVLQRQWQLLYKWSAVWSSAARFVAEQFSKGREGDIC